MLEAGSCTVVILARRRSCSQRKRRKILVGNKTTNSRLDFIIPPKMSLSPRWLLQSTPLLRTTISTPARLAPSVRNYATPPSHAQQQLDLQAKQTRLAEKAGRMKQNIGVVSPLPFPKKDANYQILILLRCSYLRSLYSVRIFMRMMEEGADGVWWTASYVRPRSTRTVPTGLTWRQRIDYFKADWGNDIYTLYLCALSLCRFRMSLSRVVLAGTDFEKRSGRDGTHTSSNELASPTFTRIQHLPRQLTSLPLSHFRLMKSQRQRDLQAPPSLRLLRLHF